MYVILTAKPGIFKTEFGEGLIAVATYDYLWFGRKKASFVIAKIEGNPRITIVEDEPPHIANHIPSKFLRKYDSVEAAHRDLQQLASFSGSDATLEKVSGPPAAAHVTGSLRVTFISNAGKTVTAPINSNLLRVSLREQGGIPFKCGGGVCGTCKCRIEAGLQNTDEIKPKERKHLSEDEFRQGYRMACQTFLTGDVSVSWSPRPAASALPRVEQTAGLR